MSQLPAPAVHRWPAACASPARLLGGGSLRRDVRDVSGSRQHVDMPAREKDCPPVTPVFARLLQGGAQCGSSDFFQSYCFPCRSPWATSRRPILPRALALPARRIPCPLRRFRQYLRYPVVLASVG